MFLSAICADWMRIPPDLAGTIAAALAFDEANAGTVRFPDLISLILLHASVQTKQ
jgi:hypothetical protein